MRQDHVKAFAVTRRRGLKAASALLVTVAALAAGCATRRDLTAEQVAKLQAAGFVPSPDGGWEYLLQGRILFETDVDTLDADSLLIVGRLAPMLNTLGISTVRVEGHTDNVGTEAYNKGLSLRRAQAVARALEAQGVVSAGIQVVGWGKERPLVDNAGSGGRAQNRRVAIIVPGP